MGNAKKDQNSKEKKYEYKFPNIKILDLKNENIVPLHNSSRTCVEDFIATFANWYKIDYQLIYINSWGFLYQNHDNYNDYKKFGIRIDAGSGNIVNLMENFYGIKMMHHSEKTFYDFNKTLEIELNQQRPVIIPCDTYWIPWDPGFKRENHDAYHFIAIVGVDYNKKEFYCLDPTYLKDWEPIPIEYFLNGYLGYYFTIIKPETFKNPEIDWQNIILNALDRINGKKEIPNIFSAIRLFADDLLKYMDIKKEVEGHRNFLRGEIFSILLSIAMGRKQFSHLLKYFGSKFNLSIFKKFIDELDYIGNGWESVRALLLKYYVYDKEGKFSDFDNSFKADISKKIHELATMEEILAVNLKDSILNYSNKKINKPEITLESNIDQNRIKHQKYEFVNLKKIFNNHGCGSTDETKCTADFNGMKEFFIIDSMPKEGDFQVEKLHFYFPKLEDGKFDNLVCFKQAIEVLPKKYSELWILGCGDESNITEKITIKFYDDTEEKITIQFTSWWVPKEYNEIIAWKGKVASMGNNKMHITPHLFTIYAQRYNINSYKNIKKIILPDCPNLHIFGLTLALHS